MTLAELKAKYKIESAKYEPKPDCLFCKGTGERPIKSRPTEKTFCICLYVDHSASDEIGQMLGKHATDMLKRAGLRDQP